MAISATASDPGAFEKLLEQASVRRDLSWFFADWVDADKGLPDLSIDSVFPNRRKPATGWSPSTSPMPATPPLKSRSPSAPTPTPCTQRVVVPARGKAVQRILILGKPTEVQVNDGTVPETQASVHITHLDTAP